MELLVKGDERRALSSNKLFVLFGCLDNILRLRYGSALRVVTRKQAPECSSDWIRSGSFLSGISCPQIFVSSGLVTGVRIHIKETL